MHFSRFLLFNIAVALCHLLCTAGVQAQSTLPPVTDTPATIVASELALLLPPATFTETYGPSACMLPSEPLLPAPSLQAQSTQTVAPQVSPLQSTPLPGTGEKVVFNSDRQWKEGSVTHLRGKVEIFYRDIVLNADEVDYSDETQIADARGHVHFIEKTRDENLFADTASYNLADDTGHFTKASGSDPCRPRDCRKRCRRRGFRRAFCR